MMQRRCQSQTLQAAESRYSYLLFLQRCISTPALPLPIFSVNVTLIALVLQEIRTVAPSSVVIRFFTALDTAMTQERYGKIIQCTASGCDIKYNW